MRKRGLRHCHTDKKLVRVKVWGKFHVFHSLMIFTPKQPGAAAARRPHIHTSVLCDLQLLSAEHPRPLQSSGNPAHHCNQRHLFSLEASNAVIPLFYDLAFGKVTKWQSDHTLCEKLVGHFNRGILTFGQSDKVTKCPSIAFGLRSSLYGTTIGTTSTFVFHINLETTQIRPKLIIKWKWKWKRKWKQDPVFSLAQT